MTVRPSIEARRQVLRHRFPSWQPVSLAGWLDACADRYPSRPFVLADSATMTYHEVAEESRRLAAGLSALGVRAGDRVGMLMANYPEFVSVKFAIARVGAIAVPFNYLYRENELAFVLADSGCRVLVTMTEFGSLDYQHMLDTIVPGWHSPGFADREAGADGLPELRRVVVLDTGVNLGAVRCRCGRWRISEVTATPHRRSGPWTRCLPVTCSTPRVPPAPRKASW